MGSPVIVAFSGEHRAAGCRFNARSDDLAGVGAHCQVCPVWRTSCLTCGESVEKKDLAQHQGTCQKSEDAKEHHQAISAILLDDATQVVLAKRRSVLQVH